MSRTIRSIDRSPTRRSHADAVREAARDYLRARSRFVEATADDPEAPEAEALQAEFDAAEADLLAVLGREAGNRAPVVDGVALIIGVAAGRPVRAVPVWDLDEGGR